MSVPCELDALREELGKRNYLPILFAPGRHVLYKKQTPLCNLYVSMLKRMGAPVEHFGDSTEALPGMEDGSFAGEG